MAYIFGFTSMVGLDATLLRRVGTRQGPIAGFSMELPSLMATTATEYE